MCPTSPPTSTAFSKGSARFVYKPWLDLQAHFIFPIPPLRVLVLLLHSQANKLHHWSTNSPAPIIFFIGPVVRPLVELSNWSQCPFNSSCVPGGSLFTCTPLKFAKKKNSSSSHYFGYPVRTQLSVLTRVKILRSYLVLLLVCVAIFRVPTGAYGELRASPFFDSSTLTKTSHARPPPAQAVLGLVSSLNTS